MITDYLGKIVDVIVDRPLGSKHPKFDFLYEINYGYVPNTISGDGEEIDAYILGVDVPLKNFSGKVIAIIHRLNDDDDKLIVAKVGQDYTDDEMRKAAEFQEKYFKSIIIRNK